MITFVYYHRLHFPSESGQTIQVLRDYHALARQGAVVNLLYRCRRPLSVSEQHAALGDVGLEPLPGFHLEPVLEGSFGKRRLRRAVEGKIGEAADSVICVRTMEHAADALAIRDNWRRARVVLELHETAIPHMVYREEGRRLRAFASRFVESRIFKRVDALIATVPSQLALLDQIYPRHAPAEVLPNGVPDGLLDSGPCANPVHDGMVHLRYAGQLCAWKNCAVMIEALRHLPKRYVLDIAGGKSESAEITRDTLAKAARKAGVTGRVNYVGFVPPVEVPKFLAGAHALLLPLGENAQSRHFTSPMKLFEYAASGVAMVVTRQPTTLSLIDDGKQALMTDPNSAAQLAQAARRLVEEPGLADRLAANAKEWVRQYGYQRRANRFTEFLASVGTVH